MATRLPPGLEPIEKSSLETTIGAAGQFGQGAAEGLASTLALPVDLVDAVIRREVSASLPAGLEPLPVGPSKGQRLATIHPSMAGWTPAKAVNYRGVPFHPGAVAAFRAAGANPPA